MKNVIGNTLTRRRSGGTLASLTAALVVSAACMSQAAAQDTTTFTVSGFVPEQQTMATSMRKWAADVTEQSDGRLQFNFFWSSALLPADATAQGVRDGRADIGLVAQAYTPSLLPLSTVHSIPFITSNVRAFANAFVDTYNTSPEMKAEFEQAGLHMLTFMPASVNLFYSKEPLNTVDDLKNKRIRSLGYGVPALQAIGANPVAIAQDQVYEGLSKGLLDAVSGVTLDLGVDFGFHTVAPYIIDPNYGVYGSGMYAINREKYEALDPELRAILDEMGDKFLDEYYFPELLNGAADRCRIAKESGATISVWDEAETEVWRSALGDSIREQWIETASAASDADAEAFLAAYEGKIREYEESMEWNGPVQACLNAD